MENSDNASVRHSSWYERSWRWWVLGTLFLATFLNYLDRQTLSVAADPISEEFGLSNIERGDLLAAFVFSYAFAHLFIGFLLDRVKNIRRFFPIMLIGWSLTNMLVGFAQNYTSVLCLRYLLGIWESANFPLCLLIIARVFPAKERSLAAGIFNSGAVIATLVAPKLVIYLSNTYNWRYGFIVTGLFGIIWLLPWLTIFRKPEQRALYWPKSNDSEKSSKPAEKANIQEIFRSPAFWGVLLIGVGIIPGWYFMSQWLPSYLTQAWNMPYDQALGNKLTIIYFFQDLGLWLSGAFVWWLARRGISILNSRKVAIAASYLMMMSVMFLSKVNSITWGIVILCIYVFGLAAWQANQQAFKQDVSRTRVATVAALVGFAETGFSAYIVQKVGTITQQTGGYNAIFLLLAGFFTFSLIILFTLLRPKWIDIK